MTILTEAPKKREYFFKKGNKYSQGAPLSSKKQMDVIRRRILMVVRRRLMHEKDLQTVSTTDLIKFLGTIMPKDYSMSVKPELTYVSHVPRDEEPALPEPTPAQAIVEDIVEEAPQEETPVLEEQPIAPVEEVPELVEPVSEVPVPQEEPIASQPTT